MTEPQIWTLKTGGFRSWFVVEICAEPVDANKTLKALVKNAYLVAINIAVPTFPDGQGKFHTTHIIGTRRLPVAVYSALQVGISF